MLFTGTHFAQVLEGEDASVELLMDALRRDPRHDQIRIARRAALARRRFGDFAMAYMGPSQFVSRQVTRLLDNPSPCDQRRLTDWLIELMSEFACDPADQPFFYISPTGTTHLRTSD